MKTEFSPLDLVYKILSSTIPIEDLSKPDKDRFVFNFGLSEQRSPRKNLYFSACFQELSEEKCILFELAISGIRLYDLFGLQNFMLFLDDRVEPFLPLKYGGQLGLIPAEGSTPNQWVPGYVAKLNTKDCSEELRTQTVLISTLWWSTQALLFSYPIFEIIQEEHRLPKTWECLQILTREFGLNELRPTSLNMFDENKDERSVHLPRGFYGSDDGLENLAPPQ